MSRNILLFSIKIGIFSTLCTSSESHVMLQGGTEYDSQPAAFGTIFQNGIHYEARVQKIDDDPYLCGVDKSGNATHGLPSRQEDKIIVPKDGSPVLLMAEKGHCPYEKKARVAMSYGPVGVVKYVLVYDDKPDENRLVTMFPDKDPRGITVGLQFLSYASGMDIRLQINEETAADKAAGGLVIILDSNTQYQRHYSWVGMLMIITSFACSLFSCCTSGLIRRDGAVLLVGQNQIQPGVLTQEDVDRLPEIEYTSELRLKTDTENSTEFQQDDIESNPSLETPLLPNDDESFFENVSCCVCLEEYVDGEKLRILPCKHAFHSHCIIPWLTERQATCPLCKAFVADGLPRDEEAVETIEEPTLNEEEHVDNEIGRNSFDVVEGGDVENNSLLESSSQTDSSPDHNSQLNFQPDLETETSGRDDAREPLLNSSGNDR